MNAVGILPLLARTRRALIPLLAAAALVAAVHAQQPVALVRGRRIKFSQRGPKTTGKASSVSREA